MKIFNISIITMLILLIVSCGNNSDIPVRLPVELPITYEWVDNNGNNTVSFEGQTVRLKQAAEISLLMGSQEADFTTLDEMFNLGEGFSDPSLNYSNSAKKVANKTASYSINSVDIVNLFNSWIVEFTSDVVPAMIAGTVATPGNAGVLADGTNLRELNAKGMELDQLFTKGLIGALCGDQIINGYLSEIKIADDIDNVRGDNGGYTTMEHHWDEAYGYLYGLQTNPSLFDVTNTNGDVLLFKYYAKADFFDIQDSIFNSFKLGREAISLDANNGGTTLYSDVKMNEVDKIKKHISHIVGQKAFDYINGAAQHLESGGARNGSFFHGLSEGVGFVVSLQFTYNDGKPYFSYSQVNSMLETLSSENGLWDVTIEELNQMALEIQTAFSL
ncbi:MAG: DUF4856 domain-containing protein [Flavobacteriales bacterium]